MQSRGVFPLSTCPKRLPDFTASKHPCVHDVRADQSGFDAVQVLGPQLVGQRLVETDGSKLTRTVILKEESKHHQGINTRPKVVSCRTRES